MEPWVPNEAVKDWKAIAGDLSETGWSFVVAAWRAKAAESDA
jgi:hypothetical protein